MTVTRVRNWLLLGVFAAVSVFLLIHHEPWRDETRAWLVARDMPDLPALLRSMGYEGSPGLWFILLRPLAALGLPFVAQSVLHHLLALAAAALLVFGSPFRFWQRALILLGYFFLYEYNAIARSYVLSVGLLWAVAATYATRDRHPWRHGLLLALLAQTNTHSLLLAVLWGAFWLAEMIWRKPPVAWRAAAGALALVGGSAVLAVWQMRPPLDMTPDLAPWHLPALKEALWNSLSILVNVLLPQLKSATMGVYRAQMAVVGLLVMLAASLFRRRGWALLHCYGGLAMLFALYLTKYAGHARHHGFVLLVLLSALWMAWSETSAPEAAPRRRRWEGLLLALLLLPGVWGAGRALHREWRTCFSAARPVATYLRQQGLYGPDVLLATYPAVVGTGVLAWLPRKQQAYLVELRRPGTYVEWTRELAANRQLAPAEVLRRVDEAAARGHYRRVLVLVGGRKDYTLPENERTVYLHGVTAIIRPDETLQVYERRPASGL